MSASFSLILPVYDVEHMLRGYVIRLLEAALSVASRFDLLVIDQGSRDQTYDVASALAREYPQVAVIRRADRQSPSAVQRLALSQGRGQVLLIHDGSQRVSGEEWLALYRSPMIARSRPGERFRLGPWSAVGRGPLPAARSESAAAAWHESYLSRIQAWA